MELGIKLDVFIRLDVNLINYIIDNKIRHHFISYNGINYLTINFEIYYKDPDLKEIINRYKQFYQISVPSLNNSNLISVPLVYSIKELFMKDLSEVEDSSNIIYYDTSVNEISVNTSNSKYPIDSISNSSDFTYIYIFYFIQERLEKNKEQINYILNLYSWGLFRHNPRFEREVIHTLSVLYNNSKK